MNLKKNKVSFDFDDTLDDGRVQHVAKALIKLGYDIWITTSRMSDDMAPSEGWNNDLFFVAFDILDIEEDRIIFTSYEDKYSKMHEHNFLFHLDDDQDEIVMINNNTDTVGINHKIQLDWKQIINKLHEQNKL